MYITGSPGLGFYAPPPSPSLVGYGFGRLRGLGGYRLAAIRRPIVPALSGRFGQDDEYASGAEFEGGVSTAPVGAPGGWGDLTTDQIVSAANAYNSGALSAAGLNQLMSGNVTSGNFQDFLDADPGASAAPAASGQGVTAQVTSKGVTLIPAGGTSFTAAPGYPFGTAGPSTNTLVLLGAGVLAIALIGKRRGRR